MTSDAEIGGATPPALDERLERLERRIAELEAERDIQRVIVTYGFAVDSGDADATRARFEDDAVFDIGTSVMNGADEVHAMVCGAAHQSLLPGAAHTIGPAVVHVDGDHAVATGYSRIYRTVDGRFELFRLAANRWELTRTDGTWRIARRDSRVANTVEYQSVLRGGL
jgi:ketosteroid isomerase-like protein